MSIPMSVGDHEVNKMPSRVKRAEWIALGVRDLFNTMAKKISKAGFKRAAPT